MMREQGKQRKLIDRWREDKNPVGVDPDYKYDKSAYPAVKFRDLSHMSMEDALELLDKEEKAKKSNIDRIEEV